MLTHVVLFTFHDQADATEAQRRLEGLLDQCPDLLSVEARLDGFGEPGAAHLSLRTTHHGIEGLRAYQADPAHVEYRDWLIPRLATRSVVDFES